MQRLHWYLGSLLLGAVLIAPAAMNATAFSDQHNCTDNDSAATTTAKRRNAILGTTAKTARSRSGKVPGIRLTGSSPS